MSPDYIVWLRPPATVDELRQALRARGTVTRQLRTSRRPALVSFASTRDDAPQQILDRISFVESYEPDDIGIHTIQARFPDPAEIDWLGIHKVRAAWDFLERNLRLPRFGSSEVCIGLVQRHPLDPLDARVSPSLAFGFDCDRGESLVGNVEYSARVRRFFQGKDHAMSVYGILAAAPVAQSPVAGLASGARVVFVCPEPRLASVFAELLLWLGGVNQSPPLGLGLGERASPTADVICITIDSIKPLPRIIAEASDQLASSGGRHGTGTVIVCSAGNDNQPVNWLASHRSVIGVANCEVDRGTERHWEQSNFGSALDLCATGQGVRTIVFQVDDSSPTTRPFGGTSAAAPLVAGAAALMLSARRGIPGRSVADLLRQSAEVIDRGNSNPEGRWHERNGRLFSSWYGFGRLDVEAAVRRAASLT